MGGDLVEEEDRAAAGALGDEIGMGEDEADQQRLLLAGRGQSGGLALAEMGDGEIGAVRPRQRAAGGGVARAARPRGRPPAPPSSASAARANGPSGAAASRSPSAADRGGARFGDRGAMLGHPGFERRQPGLVPGRRLGQQLVARPHRRFVAGGVAGMIGPQREHQPVEEAAAARGGVGEQPVHGGSEPEHGQPFGQRIGRGRGAVDADLAALGRVGERCRCRCRPRRPAPRPRSRRRRPAAPFRRGSRP